MQPDANDRRTYNAQLLAGFVAYVLFNACGIALGATGVIHPPWELLGFFTYGGPSLAILFVCTAQVLRIPRPFAWAAVVGFVVAMLFVASINRLMLIGALASV